MTDFESFESIKVKSEKKKHTWYSELKKTFFLFLLFLMINSQVFITVILSKISGATESNLLTTNKGVIIQGIFLSLAYICVSILVDQKWV
jgi:hypothetical protein